MEDKNNSNKQRNEHDGYETIDSEAHEDDLRHDAELHYWEMKREERDEE